MAITDGYCSLDDVKADLRLVTTADDDRLERAIEAASRMIDNTTHRKFTAVTEVRTFSSSGYTVWTDDATSVTSVTESDDQVTWTAVTATKYVTNPRPPIRSVVRIDGSQWLRFVRIDAAWGTATIPAEVRQACRIQAVRLFKRADTPEGILAGDFGAARLARVDPDVLGLIRPLARPAIG